MKIVCIGRNYAKHAEELASEIPLEPIVFTKPADVLFSSGAFEIPAFSKDLHYELEIVVKIHKKGKNIQKQQAASYYKELALGIDFTARDIQKELIKKGLPWEKAKVFDQSAFVSSFFSKEKIDRQTEFSLNKNGRLAQIGTRQQMIFSIEELIASISQYFTLCPGDLIYTGTPQGVGAVLPGDVLEGYLSKERVFKLKIA